MGQFWPPESGSGFRIRIRIHWLDWIRIQLGSEPESAILLGAIPVEPFIGQHWLYFCFDSSSVVVLPVIICSVKKKNENNFFLFRATWGAVGHGALYHSQVIMFTGVIFFSKLACGDVHLHFFIYTYFTILIILYYSEPWGVLCAHSWSESGHSPQPGQSKGNSFSTVAKKCFKSVLDPKSLLVNPDFDIQV